MPKKRKPVPKLASKTRSDLTVSDNTQALLDNQLREPSPALPTEESTMTKKAGLKMPNRTRAISTNATLKNSNLERPRDQDIITDSVVLRPSLPIVKSPRKSSSTSLKEPPTKSTALKSRPRTPERSPVKRLDSSIISPSNLDFDEMNLSINRNETTKISATLSPIPASQMSPKASPGRLKLKDRLTSDLEGMVMDLDTTVETSIFIDNDELASNKIVPDLTYEDSYQKDSQTSSTYVQSSQSQGPKVTYGASRWTFLPDNDEDATLLNPIFDSAETNNADKKTRQLPNLIKSSSKVDAFDIEDDDEEPTGTMRSLHELKQAGGSQRINKQAEAILDDVEHSSGKSQRLTALLELISKLRQSVFLRQFLDASLETRLLNFMDVKSDSISKFIYCIALLLVLDDPKLSTVCMANDPLKISSFLAGLLAVKSDINTIVKIRGNHVPKDIQKEIERLCGSMRLSSIWPEIKPSVLTPRIVALTCLERLVRKLRESGYQGDVVSMKTVHELVNMLVEWPSEDNADNSLTIWLSLSALESASLVYSFPESQTVQSWDTELGVKVISFYMRIQRSGSDSKHEELLSLSLRLCLNLSNGDARNCTMFLNTQFIRTILKTIISSFNQLAEDDGKADVKQDMILDNLVLSLGLLINLSEKDERTREIFLHGDRADDTALEMLISLFSSRVQEVFEVTSEKEARTNVPFGYLVVLLGYLCKSTNVFAIMRSRLNGGTLRVLLIAIGEFLHYHQKVEELRVKEGGEQVLQEQDIKSTFVSRLQGLMEELQAKDDLAALKSADM